jgi:large subunit ribosomal protein L22
MRGSARKMRLVADLVRGKPVDEALDMLSVLPRGAAAPVFKTVKSAAANALASEGTAKLKSEDLRIKTIYVDGGPIMKRIRPMGMGRAYRLRKRLCHLTVVLEGEHEPADAKAAPGRRATKAPAKKAAAQKSAARKHVKKPAKKTAPKKGATKTAAKKKSGTGAKKAKGDG